MKVHHLHCATMCPPLGGLVNEERRMVCHCLLIETGAGLVLVDTGLGTADIERPAERLGRWFLPITRPRLDPEETALHQVRRLGFSQDDVRHVLPTQHPQWTRRGFAPEGDGLRLFRNAVSYFL